MKLRKIPAHTKLLPGCRSRIHEGGSEAILLIHGFRTFIPEFDYLYKRLVDEGYTVSLPRLPGHGTNAADFHESCHRDWLRKVTDEYLLLKTLYPKVYIAGLSMGALLALILAEVFDPDRIALLAPAISIRNKFVHLSPYLKYIIPKAKGDWVEEQEKDPERIPYGREYWTHTDLAKVADMLALRKRALKNLSQVGAPTLTIVSEADKTVAPDAIQIVEDGISSSEKEHYILQESSHVIVNSREKEEVADLLIRWFKKE